MSFILAQTLLYQLQMLEGALLSRINHISLIYSEVKAIVDAKDTISLSQHDTELLNATEINIEVLRDTYEPFLDEPDSKLAADEKRKLAEKIIDLSRYNLLFITEKYKLVDVRTLQEVTGSNWGAE